VNALGAPLLLGVTRLPSRCFLAPVNTGFSVAGVPAPELVAFHRERSGKAIGVAYVGNVAVAGEFSSNATTPYFGSELAPWRELVDAIAGNDSVPAIQLACRLAASPARRRWRTPGQRNDLTAASAEMRAISTRQIDQVVAAFVQSAERAIRLGFRIVQIHAAHGYFLAQLLSPTTNQRTDEYGKDRMLALRRIVEGIRSLSDVPLDVRVSLREGLASADFERDTNVAQVAELVDLGVDMISLSAGTYEFTRELIYPAERDGENILLNDALAFCRQHSKTFWNIAGNIRQLRVVGQTCPGNLTVSLARPLIADPSFIEKQLSGREGDVRACDWSGKCHYYTRGAPHISCPISRDLP
jgi:2,4-dienoyl-CoA reductase-like NADH-dependent reductase (Old Yellow Enzyme family)